MTSDFNVAVHAVVVLNHKQEYVNSIKLAENICTNPARVRKVVGQLVDANIVQRKEGVQGGYRFILDPKTISLTDIATALSCSFCDASWHSGNVLSDCGISKNMGKILEEIFQDLDEVCKKALSKITIDDIDSKIFQNKNNGG